MKQIIILSFFKGQINKQKSYLQSNEYFTLATNSIT